MAKVKFKNSANQWEEVGYSLNAHNLLDNSNFKNYINQRGSVSGLAPANQYIIDRWYTRAQGQVTLSAGHYVENKVALNQKIPMISGTKATAAYKLVGAEPVYKVLDIKANSTSSVSLMSVYCPSDKSYLRVVINPGKYEWVALYEGEFTEMPAYVPKDYATELTNCMRCYQQIMIAYHPPAITSTGARYYACQLMLPMRATPTISNLTDGTLAERREWTDTKATLAANGGGPTLVAISATGNISSANNCTLTGTLKVTADYPAN